MNPLAYLAGPMTGYDLHNYPLFNSTAAKLRDRGLVVINPAGNFDGFLCDNATRQHYMQVDISHVLNSDIVIVLPLWYNSQGARTEVQVAFETGKPVFDFDSEQQLEPVDITRETGYEGKMYRPTRYLEGWLGDWARR